MSLDPVLLSQLEKVVFSRFVHFARAEGLALKKNKYIKQRSRDRMILLIIDGTYMLRLLYKWQHIKGHVIRPKSDIEALSNWEQFIKGASTFGLYIRPYIFDPSLFYYQLCPYSNARVLLILSRLLDDIESKSKTSQQKGFNETSENSDDKINYYKWEQILSRAPIHMLPKDFYVGMLGVLAEVDGSIEAVQNYSVLIRNNFMNILFEEGKVKKMIKDIDKQLALMGELDSVYRSTENIEKETENLNPMANGKESELNCMTHWINRMHEFTELVASAPELDYQEPSLKALMRIADAETAMLWIDKSDVLEEKSVIRNGELGTKRTSDSLAPINFNIVPNNNNNNNNNNRIGGNSSCRLGMSTSLSPRDLATNDSRVVMAATGLGNTNTNTLNNNNSNIILPGSSMINSMSMDANPEHVLDDEKQKLELVVRVLDIKINALNKQLNKLSEKESLKTLNSIDRFLSNEMATLQGEIDILSMEADPEKNVFNERTKNDFLSGELKKLKRDLDEITQERLSYKSQLPKADFASGMEYKSPAVSKSNQLYESLNSDIKNLKMEISSIQKLGGKSQYAIIPSRSALQKQLEKAKREGEMLAADNL